MPNRTQAIANMAMEYTGAQSLTELQDCLREFKRLQQAADDSQDPDERWHDRPVPSLGPGKPNTLSERLRWARRRREGIAGKSKGPAEARYHPPMKGTYIEPLYAPTDWLVVPDTELLAIVGAGDTSTSRLTFQGGAGFIIGWRGIVIGQPDGNFSMQFQAAMDRDEPLITNGDDRTFVTFANMFSGVTAQWSPVMRYVGLKDRMTFIFRNRSTAVAQEPELVLGFMREYYPGAPEPALDPDC